MRKILNFNHKYSFVDLVGGIGAGGVAAKTVKVEGSLIKNEVKMVDNVVETAQNRQYQMLNDDIGYNISPISTDKYNFIGKNGTFVTDKEGVSTVVNHPNANTGLVTISSPEANTIEQDLGLMPGSLSDGFKVRELTEISLQHPRSPIDPHLGNEHFQGAGEHLPSGAPEVVIDSVSTTDGSTVKTIIKVNVESN